MHQKQNVFCLKFSLMLTQKNKMQLYVNLLHPLLKLKLSWLSNNQGFHIYFIITGLLFLCRKSIIK